MEHREYGMFEATEGGGVTLLHIGLRDYHKVMILGARTHYGP